VLNKLSFTYHLKVSAYKLVFAKLMFKGAQPLEGEAVNTDFGVGKI